MQKSPRVIIIGAGMSGLCMAIRLKQAGFQRVTILESASDVGGTWFKNTYPNAGCDVPSYLYCYSFATDFDWSTKYARQPEILTYFRLCADRYSVRCNIRFRSTVSDAVFDQSTATWRVTTDDGQTLTAEILVSAVGQLNRPSLPDIAGLESFSGPVWHSARWNHDCDLAGKTVAVIGNGASAIQFVPTVAAESARLLMFQRTASWIHPLHNYRYPGWVRWMFRNLPGIAKLHRLWIYLMCELRVFAFRRDSKLNLEYSRWLRSRMRKKIPPDQWSKLIPDYAPGCKRVLLSSDYLQTLSLGSVDVITDPIESFEQHGIQTRQGSHAVDIVIFATGFKANEFLQPMQINGRDGQRLHDFWGDRPKAMGGMVAPGFPNFFMLYGPNTNLGHNSIIFMVERQVDFIIQCLRHMQQTGSREVEVRQEALDRYDETVQQQLRTSIWASGCTSWYKTADGSQPNNWPGSATAFWRRMKRPTFTDFRWS